MAASAGSGFRPHYDGALLGPAFMMRPRAVAEISLATRQFINGWAR